MRRIFVCSPYRGPVADAFMHDTQLATDCVRDAQLRCVPAQAATVATWFYDASCALPIAVAMVNTGTCAPPTRYAATGETYHPILEPYAGQLYQLEPGDRCGPYVPPAPYVAHRIGPDLPADAFARAQLATEGPP